MCGIVGLFLRHSACDAVAIDRMRDLVVHRGPDDSGSFVAGPVGLGHRRLSIIDLGSGHQPMATADGRFTIVFNGEIYNYRELRRELEAEGARFRTLSDTEVILHLHARSGDAAVRRLNGIFAYALWDAAEQRLLLVRDRAGIKPLYYSATTQGVAFGSEIKSLFLSGCVPARIATRHVGEYLLYRHVAGTETLFEGVQSLSPGHMLEIRAGQPGMPLAYWDPNAFPAGFQGTFDDAVEALDGVLRAAVERQLVADVPVGTFCSGGIDSSLVTAMAARHAPGAINTYSVGFDDSRYDESAYARMAASACGTRHHELRLSEAEFAAALPNLVWHHDLPLNFANSVHIYAVSRLARGDVTVVLTGEGSDELFGGYPRYYIPRLLAPLGWLPATLRGGLGAALRSAPDHRLVKLGAFLRRDRDAWLLFNNATADPDVVAPLLPETTDLRGPCRRTCLAEALAAAPDRVTALAALDFRTYLSSILDRQDKMSMATSIEARVPFLDNEVIDFARSLPLAYRQTLRSRKRVLKHVAMRYLPADIVHRRKSGFGVPLPEWFAGDGPVARLATEAIESGRLTDLLDVDVLRQMRTDHAERRADYSDVLWPAVNLHLWRAAFDI
jgi:asparagine synthase (glutamine-hydrolysing)